MKLTDAPRPAPQTKATQGPTATLEKGATSILTSLVAVILLGSLGFAVDLGNAMQLQRKAQNAADSAAFAGVAEYNKQIEYEQGLTPGVALTAAATTRAKSAAVAEAKRYADRNFSVSAAAWNACTDANRPSGYEVMAGSPECISILAASAPRIRVRVPMKVNTTFGRVLGTNMLSGDGVAIVGSNATTTTTTTTTIADVPTTTAAPTTTSTVPGPTGAPTTTAAPTTTTTAAPVGPGVSGGHFDADIYHKASGAFANKQHVHQYDDKYNVTGVNFLNPSDPALNLANAIPIATTNFKVIVADQYLNPASRISIGGSAATNVKNFGILASSTDATAVLASLPTYNRNNIQTFAFSLPLDAFKTKDWWADGSPRAGVIPTQTGCVNKITNSSTGTTGGQIGPNGERFDGALTITVIDAATTASDLQLAYTAGGAKYGWRVKSTSFSRVLAEYTFFWHHSNGYCYGNGSWLANAPEQTSSTFAAVTPPAGTGDPVNGN